MLPADPAGRRGTLTENRWAATLPTPDRGWSPAMLRSRALLVTGHHPRRLRTDSARITLQLPHATPAAVLVRAARWTRRLFLSGRRVACAELAVQTLRVPRSRQGQGYSPRVLVLPLDKDPSPLKVDVLPTKGQRFRSTNPQRHQQDQRTRVTDRRISHLLQLVEAQRVGVRLPL